MQHGLQVKLASALLEEVFERLAEQVHNHDVIHFTVVGLLIADEVEEGHEGLSSHLVNELTLPEKHDVSLHFNCFFLK